jgi:hypothetical protein
MGFMEDLLRGLSGANTCNGESQGMNISVGQTLQPMPGFIGDLLVNAILGRRDVQANYMEQDDRNLGSLGKTVDDIEHIDRTPVDIDGKEDSLWFHKPESVHAMFCM